MEEKILQMMKTLDISREDAIELLQFDDDVDKNKVKDNFTAEQKKAVKKYTKVSKAVNAYGKTVTRTRKEDKTKQMIIETIANALKAANIETKVTNAEKYIDIILNDEEYTINLVKHRKGKN